MTGAKPMAAKKRGLGRGLEALLGPRAAASPAATSKESQETTA